MCFTTIKVSSVHKLYFIFSYIILEDQQIYVIYDYYKSSATKAIHHIQLYIIL